MCSCRYWIDKWGNPTETASLARITHNELAEIIDCYGPKILDLLMMPLETKKELLELGKLEQIR